MATKAEPHTWDYGKAGARKLGKVWHLERLVNFGVKKGRIDTNDLRANFSKLKIDPAKKAYLERLLKND